jgi:hypothetical protein
MVRSRRSTLASLATVLSQRKNSVSPAKMPRLRTMLLNLRSPGILTDENSLKSPSRYSITCASWVSPETSVNPARCPRQSTVKWNAAMGYRVGMVRILRSGQVKAGAGRAVRPVTRSAACART